MAIADLVLGTMYFGTTVDEATSWAILDAFVEAGGTTLDTANAYSFWMSGTGRGGQSEQVIGRWLARRPGLRERLVIATKVGVHPEPGGSPGRLEGLSAGVIRRELDASRRRLGIDTVDVYWAHADDRHTPLEQTVAALAALVRDGAVRRLGASNYATWRVERARALAAAAGLEPFTALQLADSYLHRRPDAPDRGEYHAHGAVGEETRDYLDAHPDMELWVYSPLLRGAYDRPDRPLPPSYDHPGTTRRRRVLEDTAAQLGVNPGQVVLSWLMHPQRAVRPIVGVSALRQLRDALEAAELVLDDDERARLDAAG